MDQADNNITDGMIRDKILVTGASGFIGGHVTRYLAGHGLEVSCLVRNSSDVHFIKDLPVRIVMGDITDQQSLVKAFAGMDVIIHTAAKVDDWGKYKEFYRVNVTGTLNVLEAAVNNGIRRIIMTGSVSSYGEEHHPGLKDESSPYHSHYPYCLGRLFPSGMNHYRDSKAICTQKAIEFAETNGLDLMIMEPVWVYGENEFSSGFFEYLKTLKSGIPLIPGSKSNAFHVIYAGDLARGYYMAYKSNLKGIHRFILGNGSPENMAMIYRLFAREAGFHKPIFLPKLITYPVGFFLELIWQAFGVKRPPLLTRARVNMFYDSIGYDTSKARRVLGFEATMPLEKGISRTVNWYRENKFI